MTGYVCSAEEICPFAKERKVINILPGQLPLCPNCTSELIIATDRDLPIWRRSSMLFGFAAVIGLLLIGVVIVRLGRTPDHPPPGALAKPAAAVVSSVPSPLEMTQVRLLIKASVDHIASGKLDVAKAQLEALLVTNPKEPLAHYNLAVIALRQAQPSVALKKFRDSFESGFDRFDLMDQDKDLDTLRNDPAFRALVDQYRKS